MSNVVFYFSGTGNCLKVAKTIIEKLGNGKIISMAKQDKFTLNKKHDSIGFVFPVYFWGLPKKVIEFIENLNIAHKENCYYYSIATHGGSPGNAVYQIYELLLKRHNVKLNYGQKLHMFSNYVNYYDMKEKVTEITKKSNEWLLPIITSIKNKENNKISGMTKIFSFLNKWFLRKVSTMDKGYTVNDDCTGCALCKKVCPGKNIEMENKKPKFKHYCEQCVACIQFCPQKAINYKNLTQKRRRYIHPEIDYKEFIEANNS